MQEQHALQCNNFNFLRLVLALLVLLSHSFEIVDGNPRREIVNWLQPSMSFGGLGVQGFMLLSGYLVLQSWERDPHVGRFLARRALRVYPGFIVAVLVCAFVVGPLGAEASAYFAQLNVPRLLAKTLLLRSPSPETPPVFQGTHFPVVNGSMWTIVYEFRCYVLLALLGLLGVMRHPLWWLIFSGAVALLSLLPHLVERIAFPGMIFIFGNPLDFIRLLSFFCAGSCFYLLRARIHYKTPWAAMALMLLVPAVLHATVAQAALLTLGAYALFWLAFAPLPLLRHFGRGVDVSYGTYLYGWPMQKLLLWHWPSLHPLPLFILASALALACGFASWHLIERPFLQKKPRNPGTPASAHFTN